MAEKFHNDADKMVYQPRVLEVSEEESAEETKSPTKTPAKSASAKKES